MHQLVSVYIQRLCSATNSIDAQTTKGLLSYNGHDYAYLSPGAIE